MRRQLLACAAAIGTAVAVGFALITVPAAATHVPPVFVPGNQSCSALAPGTTELEVQPVVDGTVTDGTLTVTIDVRDTNSGQVFGWTSNIGVDAVFVKGGPSGNLYVYNPEATEDTGLHAPLNPGNPNNQFFGLSHISFCYDVEEPTPTPTNTP